MSRTLTSSGQISAHDWAAANGYGDAAAKIDKVLAIWAKNDKKTRRNWWDVLAGRKDGTPIKVEGITFPVLRAARIRKGWNATPKSLCHDTREAVPPIIKEARWEQVKSKVGA